MVEFKPDDGVFDEKRAFSESYKPDEIEAREEEIKRYKSALSPIINGHPPNNIFIYGNTGVGKTAVTEHIVSQLQSDTSQYDNIDLTVLSINCKDLTSSYQVSIRLINSLRERSEHITKTGHPTAEVYNQLYAELDQIGGTLLLILDEIDSIGNDDGLLYQLPRAKTNGKIEDVDIGIIGISNDFSFRDQIDPRARSSLCQREIQFPPYNAVELKEILASRASIGVQDNVLQSPIENDASIGYCAAIAAQDRGDARQALDIFQRAGEIASEEGADSITEDHARTAHTRYEQDQVEKGMHELTKHGQLSLLAVVSRAAQGATPCLSKEIYREYTRICEATGYDTLVLRSIQNHLRDLQMLGILTRHNRRQGEPGNHSTYELNVTFRSAFKAMEKTTALESVHNRIRQRASSHGIL